MAKNKEAKKAKAEQGQSRTKRSDNAIEAAKHPATGRHSREAVAKETGAQEAQDGAFISAEQVSSHPGEGGGRTPPSEICIPFQFDSFELMQTKLYRGAHGFPFLSTADGSERTRTEQPGNQRQRPEPSNRENSPTRPSLPLQDPAKPGRTQVPQRKEFRVVRNQSSKSERWRKIRSQEQVPQTEPFAPDRVGRRLWGIKTPQAQRGRQQVAQPASQLEPVPGSNPER